MAQSSQNLAALRTAPPSPPSATLHASPGPAAVAMLSFGAAAIHFAVSPDHFGEWVPYGIAFACLAWFQLIWSAAYLLAPGRRLAAAAVVVNAAVIVVWAWSRTMGLPIGPQPGSTEPVGFADALSSGLEALLILGLVVGGTSLAARYARRPSGWAVVLLAIAALVVLTTIAAMAALAPQPMSMG